MCRTTLPGRRLPWRAGRRPGAGRRSQEDACRGGRFGGGERPARGARPLRLGYDRLGGGPPLVLLHSLGTDRCVWHPVLEPLSRERDVIAVDLPGFGESDPLPMGKPPAPALLADAVAAFVAGGGGGGPPPRGGGTLRRGGAARG